MKQLKAYKFRIYPNDEQKIFFSKTFGCVRLVYNLMLNDRIKAYEESKGNIDKKIKYPTPAKYKKEYELYCTQNRECGYFFGLPHPANNPKLFL